MNALSSFRPEYVEDVVAKSSICQHTNNLERVDVLVTLCDKLHPIPQRQRCEVVSKLAILYVIVPNVVFNNVNEYQTKST